MVVKVKAMVEKEVEAEELEEVEMVGTMVEDLNVSYVEK